MPRPRPSHDELNLGSPSQPSSKSGLVISTSQEKSLSPAQIEFNKQMKALEKARKTLKKEAAQLDRDLQICITQILPLVQKSNQAQRDLLFTSVTASQSLKLTPRRKRALTDLLHHKTTTLLSDPTGLTEQDIKRLEALLTELATSLPDPTTTLQNEFEELRELIEGIAKQNGVQLDFSDLDPTLPPHQLLQKMQELIDASEAAYQNPSFTSRRKPNQKPTKAQLKRQQQQRDIDEAKNKDFKTLYKQLAKVLHPDLEPDPTLKAQRQIWMQRLTTARDAGDLRDMLAIELEWLGTESTDLSHISDEKLRTYTLVLKEQIQDTKDQIHHLAHQPQYQALHPHLHPFTNRLFPDAIPRILNDIADFEAMSTTLQRGGQPAQKMLHSWADHHARNFSW